MATYRIAEQVLAEALAEGRAALAAGTSGVGISSSAARTTGLASLLHTARTSRGLAREEAIAPLQEQAWLARYTRRPAAERPAWDRLADRLDRVCGRLADLARPEREREIAQRIDGWLERPRSSGAEHVAAYASAMRSPR